MHLRLRSPLAALALLALLAPAQGHAMEWRTVSSAASAHGQPADIARTYLHDNASALGLENIELTLKGSLPTSTGTTVRFVQRHRGLSVLFASAAVHVDANGAVRRVGLDVVQGLSALDTQPSVPAQDARALLAEAGFAVAASSRHELALAQLADAPHLVWHIVTPELLGGRRYYVDAHDGKILSSRPVAMDAIGRVYPINPVVTPDTDDVVLPQLDTVAPQVLRGWGGLFNVTNYVSGNPLYGNILFQQSLAPNSVDDYLYDPVVGFDTGDAFAQVATYYHLTRTREYFQQTHALPMDTNDWKVTAIANMALDGEPFDNAFYSPEGIPSGAFAAPNMVGIGDGTVDFAYDSDVIMHEFTHYISWVAVGYNAGQLHITEWGLSPYSGGIDEGISDYFSSTINGDPLVSELAMGELGVARDLANNTRVCPDDVLSEVHVDGEIIGGFTWDVRTAFGPEIADALVWNAVTMLTSGATLGDLATSMLLAADDMVALGDLTSTERDQLKTIVAGRGLDDCGQVLEIGPEQPRTVTLLGMDFLAAATGMACSMVDLIDFQIQSPFHFSAQPPSDAIGLRLNVALTPENNGRLKWDIYARAHEHVAFTSTELMGFPIPKVAAFDAAARSYGTDSASLVVDATSTPPFDPSARYYFVVTESNCPNAQADLTIEWLYDEPLVDTVEGSDVSTADATVADTVGDSGAAPDTSVPDALDVQIDPGTDLGAPDLKGSQTCGCALRTQTPGGAWAIVLAGLIVGLVRRHRTAWAR